MKILILSYFIFAFLSINGQDLPVQETSLPNIPNNYSIDLDHDSIMDLAIQYSIIGTTDIPASHEYIYGNLVVLNKNKLLWKNEIEPLLLNPLDTIRLINKENEVWTQNEVTFLSLNAKRGVWEGEWNIPFNATNLYIGVAVDKKGMTTIGWINFSLNKQNGTVHVIKKEMTDKNELVITE